MKLKTKIWLLTSAVVALIMAVDVMTGYRSIEAGIRSEMEGQAKDIRGMLMAMRRVYHQQFLDSGLPLNEKTVGFLPAHSLSRISTDFPNWSRSGMSFNNVSDQPRNPGNRADKDELAAMAWFRTHPKDDERLTVIAGPGGKPFYHYTAPIWIEKYCLKCHGNREDAPPSIAQSYSEAYGYKVGDLRGVMSIKLPADPLREREYGSWWRGFSVRLAAYAVLLLFLGMFLNRVVVARLARLEGAAGRLAAGDYSARTEVDGEDVDGEDEVGSLSHAFNGMADAIQAHAAALKESEERFRTATESMRDAFVLIEAEGGKVVWWNKAAEAMFGYGRGEILGRPLHEVLLADGPREAMSAGLAKFSRNGEGRLIGHTQELMAWHKDGHEFPVELSLSAMPLAGRWQAVGVVRDISERRRAEGELSRYRQHLEELVDQRTSELNSLFQALPDIYFRMERDGTILDFRCGRGSDLYVAPESFLGKRMQDVLPQEAGQLFSAAFARLRESGEGASLEYSLPMPVGSRFFEARLMPLGGEQMVAVVRNITERRALEEAREAAREEALRLARLRSEFLANMSHEIRTPLNGVLGMAQIGHRDSDSGSKASRHFERILESGRLLLSIVNDILDFSRIEAGKMRMERVALDIRRLVNEAGALVADRARAKGVEFVILPEADLPQNCMGDPMRLAQILANLLSNAVKFTLKGRVVLGAGREGDSLVFRVTDTGIGMSPEQIARLFNPFEQADGSTTRKFGGAGLGLSIARRLAELMGGELRVRSTLGAGSCFELHIPYLPAEDSVPGADCAGRSTGQEQRLAHCSILVAEDNEVNRLVLQDMLTDEGARVTLVGDGQQAVDMVLRNGSAAYDILLMDIQMPVMDGLEATRRILSVAPDLPIVGQTAHAMAEEREKCRAVGMVAHLSKPIDTEDLVAVVLKHARNRKL
ncbi:MAG: DUF3365 domain-containing protein [Rhodocyclaceae bacterium]|nr:DUF3365 domain-containing protein [Rhodocyclaceae bacterium]